MSQSLWNYLEVQKQDIIEGKLVVASWNMEDVRGHCSVDKSLSDEQALEALAIFSRNLFFGDDTFYQLEDAVEDVLDKAKT